MTSLLKRASEVSALAKASGALIPIDTDCEVVRDHEIDFVVRIAKNLARKESTATITDAVNIKNNTNNGISIDNNGNIKSNPFLPYDERLWVANSGPHHAILLNKFNVIDNHLLIVTREYEHQDQLLTAADFAALVPLIERHGGLGFYNGGQQAGASQHHKHLQWIPGIDLRGEICIPIEHALPQINTGSWSLQREPFPMAIARLQEQQPHPSQQQLQQQPLAEQCWHFYQQITQALKIDQGSSTAARPYNLLITPRHLWIVLRGQDTFDSISLNAMAYAGSFFVKDHATLEHLRQQGPLTALRGCAADI